MVRIVQHWLEELEETFLVIHYTASRIPQNLTQVRISNFCEGQLTKLESVGVLSSITCPQ